METQLTDPAVQDVLERAMVTRLATVSRSGRPHVNPNYFVIDGGRLWLGTSTGTLAARNVVANPDVQLLFEIERETTDRRLLRVSGTATVRTDPELLKDYKRRDARKYFGSWGALASSLRNVHRLFLTARYLSTSNPDNRHCVVEVAPLSIEWVGSAGR